MRRTILLMLLGFALAISLAVAAPKRMGEMSAEEIRDEVHRLYRDDLPYSAYIRTLTKAADAKWPNLSESEKIRYYVHVYARLMDALRFLNDQVALPAEPTARRYQAAVSISLAIDGSKLGAEYAQFYRDVSASGEFKTSESAFRETVIELWTRYERAGKIAPYSHLLLLNQSGMGGPGGQDGDGIRSSIAAMYAELGDHPAEAKWYEWVSPAGLGPLKVADALFAAKQYREAARKYQTVLAELDAWAKLKPSLKETAVAEPLQFADLTKVKQHAEQRLNEIKRLETGSGTTRPSP